MSDPIENFEMENFDDTKSFAKVNQPFQKRWKLVLKGPKEDVVKLFCSLDMEKIKFAKGIWTLIENEEEKEEEEFHAIVYFSKRFRHAAIKKLFPLSSKIEPVFDEKEFVCLLNNLETESSNSFPISLGTFASESDQIKNKKAKNSYAMEVLRIADLMEKEGVATATLEIFKNEPNNIFQLDCAQKMLEKRTMASNDLDLCKKAKQVEWMPWQQHLFNLLSQEPHPRTIFVVVDPKGNLGKSFFSITYNRLFPNTTVRLTNAREHDMFYIAQQYSMRRVILMDISRTNMHGLAYNAIEELKNGSFVSSKYASCTVDGSPPHFVIFTNEELDYKCMSLDRWHTIHLHQNDENDISFTEKTNYSTHYKIK